VERMIGDATVECVNNGEAEGAGVVSVLTNNSVIGVRNKYVTM